MGHVDRLRFWIDCRAQKSFSVRAPPDYLEATPPSTGKSIPVMKLLSSEARNTAAEASSSGVPSRPIGIIFRKYSLVPSGDPLDPPGPDEGDQGSFRCRIRAVSRNA